MRKNVQQKNIFFFHKFENVFKINHKNMKTFSKTAKQKNVYEII